MCRMDEYQEVTSLLKSYKWQLSLSEIQLSEMKQQSKPTAHESQYLLVTGIEHNI